MANYDIIIDRNSGIRTTYSDGSTAQAKLKMTRRDKEEVEGLLKLIETDRNSVNKSLLQKIGSILSAALFTPPIAGHFGAAQAQSGNNGLRIRLIIENPQIARYPWEALYHQGHFLSTWNQTPFVRGVPITGSSKRPTMTTPLKILVVVSNPDSPGFHRLNTEREIENIMLSLDDSNTGKKVQVVTERTGTRQRILKHMRSGANFNIIHFIGHGDVSSGKATLVLETEDDSKPDFLNYDDLGNMLQNEQSLGLVVLNACKGAQMSTSQAFIGLAPELVKKGVPAVIAMGFSILDNSAREFSNQFYLNLARNMPVGVNMQIARQAMYSLGEDSTDFITPILFTSLSDGNIFENSLVSPKRNELTSDHVAQTLIKRKIIYVKFLRLADKSKGIPAFKKQVRGDAESIAIYDVADYHVYTFFSRRPSSFEWRFQSTEGQIDDVLQLHPFAGLTPNADLYPVPTSSTWIHSIENLATDEVFLIIPHYNSFQKGHEDVFAIIEEQIGELHMAVDFSAVTTEIEKEPYLFTDTPKAYLIGRQGRYEPVNVKTESNRIFSANVKDIKKGESLKFQWKINWNALAI